MNSNETKYNQIFLTAGTLFHFIPSFLKQSAELSLSDFLTPKLDNYIKNFHNITVHSVHWALDTGVHWLHRYYNKRRFLYATVYRIKWTNKRSENRFSSEPHCSGIRFFGRPEIQLVWDSWYRKHKEQVTFIAWLKRKSGVIPELGSKKQCCGSGILCFFTPGSGIRFRDGGKIEIRTRDQGWNIPHNFSESLRNSF